jgi:dTDP-4-amino-4,6-dideoxygalactose transaminase
MAVRDGATAPLSRGGRAEWLPFHLPSIGEEEIAEVVDTLRSGWVTTGAKTQRLERDLAERLGVPSVLALASGTAALHLALRVCGVQAGDHVVVPTYTFTATAEVVTYLGARPLLADVDPVTCNVTAEHLERALTRRTRAVMPVHIAGLPCDMDPILELARARGLTVIEDAAHALPASYKGRKIGAIGDATAFSFYATKNVTTGEGGALTLADPARMDEARILALHGISRDAWKRYSAAGTWRYEVLEGGYKYNLSDLASSLGIHQLKKLDGFHARRLALVARYHAGLQDLDAVTLPAELPGTQHAWHLYLLRLRPEVLGIDRDQFIEELRARNIGTSVHFIPLHLHPYYQRAWGYRPGDFAGAETAFASTVSLPLYPAMRDSDVDDVVEAVWDIARRFRR